MEFIELLASDKGFNWVDIAAIVGFCYSVYITQIARSKED
jgi:hypothetical protein